jgi:hypothetical protein
MPMIVKVAMERDITMEEIARTLIRDECFLQNLSCDVVDALINEHNANTTDAEDATETLRMTDYVELLRALADTLEKGDWIKANEV